MKFATRDLHIIMLSISCKVVQGTLYSSYGEITFMHAGWKNSDVSEIKTALVRFTYTTTCTSHCRKWLSTLTPASVLLFCFIMYNLFCIISLVILSKWLIQFCLCSSIPVLFCADCVFCSFQIACSFMQPSSDLKHLIPLTGFCFMFLL